MAAIPGTPLVAEVVTTDTLDTHATHIDTFGQGGYQSVLDYTARNSITPDRRKEGMTVYVMSDQTKWQLKPGYSPTNPILLNTDWIEVTYQDIVSYLDTNAIKTKYRRGHNNSGSTILNYRVVGLHLGEVSGNPSIKLHDNYITPALGVTTTNIANMSQDKIVYYGVLSLPPGVLDTTSATLGDRIYSTDTGQLTLVWTPIVIGRVLSQSTSPSILVHVVNTVFHYLEFSFTSITTQTFSHNLGRYPNYFVYDTNREDITSGVKIYQSVDKNSITLEMNNSTSGYLILT